MRTPSQMIALLLAMTSLACGTSSSASGNRISGTPTPESLVGAWTSGRGGTMVTYDQITGTTSPISSGLAFRFAEDGAYAKAFRSSNGGSCGMVLIGTESGTIHWEDGRFELHPAHGEALSFASCTPGAVARSALSAGDLDSNAYTWRLDSDQLTITRESDGASAVFSRSP